MIWHETSLLGLHSSYASLLGKCPFCGTRTSNAGIVPRSLGLNTTEIDRDDVFASVCPACGWWEISGTIGAVFSDDDPLTPGQYSQREVMAAASLANLDLTNDSTPIDDVRKYLAARAESKGILHPRLFEETVADVFRDFGFSARVTEYSGDGGIDVILENTAGATVGVQVKRYRNSIKVEHIRSLVGALVLEGHTRGVFVTTSDFQKGCHVAVAEATRQNLPITLVSGDQFLEALKLTNAQRAEPYALGQPPFTTAPLFTMEYRYAWCEGEYIQVWHSEQSHDDSENS